MILASRIAAKAEGGEILVADTVRGLCSGKGFLFADRGEFVAKGFEEPVRVYEVRWRDDWSSEVRYCTTSDGVRIAYSDVRRGDAARFVPTLRSAY